MHLAASTQIERRQIPSVSRNYNSPQEKRLAGRGEPDIIPSLTVTPPKYVCIRKGPVCRVGPDSEPHAPHQPDGAVHHSPPPPALSRPPLFFDADSGEDGKKFKTRSGETVKLSDLLMEAVRIAGESIRKRREEEEGEGYQASAVG